MKENLENYKSIIKFIFILIIVLTIVTLAHVFFKKHMTKPDTRLSKAKIEDYIKTGKKKQINYQIIIDDINETIHNIDNSKSISKGDNVSTIAFYENATSILEKKLGEISNVIESRLDDPEKGQLHYNIEKFYSEIKVDTDNIARIYTSSIDAKLNIITNKYEKLKDKCYTLANEYRAILDK